ncbi:helix-turn-helix domain-containing protein [Paracoccus seriniphilus]|nr:helix-turn-helix domain-containing protein [Paracoccus seriniphilus]
MQLDIERHDHVKRRLRALRVTFVDIAAELGCRPSLVTMVSQGHRRSERIEQAIAGHLKLSPSEIWPDRYPTEKKGVSP